MGNRTDYREAIKCSIPIMIGYIPIAITFGLVGKHASMSLLEVFSASLLIFAGASQFMLVELVSNGVGMISVAIAVTLLNARLFIMSSSMGVHLEKVDKRSVPLIGFLLTDESFSLLSFRKEQLTARFTVTLEVICYLTWIIFSVIGYTIGEVLPQKLQDAMSTALVTLFISILVPSVKGKIDRISICILALVIYSFLYVMNILPPGWDIVIGILISTFIGMNWVKES